MLASMVGFVFVTIYCNVLTKKKKCKFICVSSFGRVCRGLGDQHHKIYTLA
jgi:hypothetical protein